MIRKPRFVPKNYIPERIEYRPSKLINTCFMDEFYDRIKTHPKGGKKTAEAFYLNMLKAQGYQPGDVLMNLGKTTYFDVQTVDDWIVFEFSIDELEDWIAYFDYDHSSEDYEYVARNQCIEFHDTAAHIIHRFLYKKGA